MAPPNRKTGLRAAPAAPAARRPPTLELPFSGEDVQPLRADDPRPQRVAQYPTHPRRPARKAEEAIPTSIYDVSQDEEFKPSFDNRELSESGCKPAFLYVERGPGTGQLVPVHQGAMVIGRASLSELRLQHASISRRHAQVTRLGERFYLKDLGSQNGTFVNRTRIATEVEIQPGDEISAGNALMKLRGPVQPAELPRTGNYPRRSKAASAVRRRSSTVRIGLLGGAVGFGLAGVFTFAVLKISRGPSYHELPTASSRTARAVVAAPVMPAKDAVAVDAAIQKAMRDAVAKEQTIREVKPAEGEPKVEASEAHVRGTPGSARETSSSKKLTATKVATRSRPTAADEAAPIRGSAGGHNPAIISHYEEGDVAAALDLARQENDGTLVSRLQKFSSAYDAAKASLAAQDGSGALRNFTAALKADEQLSKGGRGTYAAEIQKQLGSLYTLVGFKHLENDDSEDAQKAFAAAVKHDPENAKAKQQLAKLSGEASTAPAPVAKKIDDAWGDDDAAPAKPARTPTRKPAVSRAASAADAAFGD